jgi:hypothetical protein
MFSIEKVRGFFGTSLNTEINLLAFLLAGAGAPSRPRPIFTLIRICVAWQGAGAKAADTCRPGKPAAEKKAEMFSTAFVVFPL